MVWSRGITTGLTVSPTSLYPLWNSYATIRGTFLLFLSFFFFFFRATPAADESFQARVKSELQLQAYATATARPDPSRICDLRHSLWQHPILDPVSKVSVEPPSSWILVSLLTPEATLETPRLPSLQAQWDFRVSSGFSQPE